MKILHLLGANKDLGGILSVLRNLANASLHLGWKHVVLVNERYKEVRAPQLEYRFIKHLLDESDSHLRLLWGALQAQRSLFHLLTKERFDLVHAHSRGGFLAMLMARCRRSQPMVFTNHAYARRLWLYRWAASRPGMFTTVLTRAMSDYYGLSPDGDKIRIISSCCSDAHFSKPLHQPRPAGGMKDPVRLTGLGNILRWKNWHLIIAALDLLTPAERLRFQVKIIGPTLQAKDSVAYEQELRAAVERHGLSRQFHLAGPSADTSEDLRCCDWLIHPAIDEPCGVAVIEALALGLPVLAARSGGPAEFVQHGKTGLLFDPFAPAELASQLRGILANPPSLLPPASIRESVRDRSASGVLPSYVKLYGRVCS
ncbi:MAG: glycosyltransferase family 4 protein [Gammaproteobacteria bacterium]|nr:glycosyltransferase family 4 protein [Gammaproteobacteria bacterium]